MEEKYLQEVDSYSNISLAIYHSEQQTSKTYILEQDVREKLITKIIL